MKLQTMLLPTGEFVLIASNCPRTPTDEALIEFRKAIGAVGVFMTDEDVEVENAFIDETARRHDDKVTTSTYFPRARLGDQTVSLQFTAESSDLQDLMYGARISTGGDEDRTIATSGHFTDESWSTEGLSDEDLKITQNLMTGATYSPAGLVVDGEKTQAKLEPELEEALRQERATEAGLVIPYVDAALLEQPNAMAPYQSAASPGPDAELEEVLLPEADEEYDPCDCWPNGGKFQGAQIVRCTSCPFGGSNSGG